MQDDVLIVTGAASGLGAASAKLLAEEGARIVAADVDREGLERVVEEIRKNGGEAVAFPTDVAKANEVEALVEHAVDTYGTLDGIFNNAGIRDGTHFTEVTPETYHEHLAINQHGVYYGMHYAANKMRELNVEGGRIVNTASIRSYFGAKKSFRYSAAKAAVENMTKSGADALAEDGIRVTAVAPAFIDTALLKHVPEERRKRLEKKHLRGKMLSALEVAKVVRFLFSQDSVAINGSCVLADDGFLAIHG